MNTKAFIETLFEGYERDDALIDFMEELRGNLDERIADLQRRGLDPEAAVQKATGELGDVSALADEISLKKKQEVLSGMYMGTKNYITTRRMMAYLACAGVFILGAIVAVMSWFYTDMELAVIGIMLPFTLVPGGVAIYLGLTQETARNLPMKGKRAALYTASILVFLFGLFSFGLTFFVREAGLPAAIATLIPFCLPAALVLAFLLLTEKSRNKPWLAEQQKAWAREYEDRFADPATATRYGLACGALWIFTIAVFFALGFAIGFGYAWITFLLGVGGQLLLEYRFSGKKA